MFEGAIDFVSLTEAFNYSVQTITTIGYGNWVPAHVDPRDPRILTMKRLSIPFMLIAGSLFAVLVGVIANAVFELRRP
jgi:hypothetical protein